ncbi:hypothetical protein, partial [Escherichia coli]|uniref:hypothetical protein n=1 Tax=Escherichia coli TaxID=562 RepID=UPI001A7E1AE2
MRGQIVDKGRFVHAGYGMNALFGLQKQANSIYCRDDVDTGKRSASGNFAFIFTLKPRICGFIFNKIITVFAKRHYRIGYFNQLLFFHLSYPANA